MKGTVKIRHNFAHHINWTNKIGKGHLVHDFSGYIPCSFLERCVEKPSNELVRLDLVLCNETGQPNDEGSHQNK